ncbi:MAG: hypothetical protein AAB674_01405 [Patescibacteria group bacterium]
MDSQENFKKDPIEELKKKNPSAAELLKSFESLGKAVLPDEKGSKSKKEPAVRKHYSRGMTPIEFERIQKGQEGIGEKERGEESGGRD